MGTINYGSNKNFINVGYNLNEYDPEMDDDKYIISDAYNCIYELLNNYNFYFYDVELKSGYYDGFYLSIDFRYLYLDNYKEKLQALKELTQLKQFLIKCIKDFYLTEYHPGWTTAFLTIKDTLKDLKKCIKNQRAFIKKLKTDKTITSNELKILLSGGSLYE